MTTHSKTTQEPGPRRLPSGNVTETCADCGAILVAATEDDLLAASCACPAPTLTRLLVLSLSCLACGDEDELVTDDLTRLPPLPRRCGRCNGSMVAVDASVRQVRQDVAIDWLANRPRRGRPPKHRSFKDVLRGPAPADSLAYRLGASASVGRQLKRG